MLEDLFTLPGMVRAALHDLGVTESTIEACEIAWDGEAVVIPIRDGTGQVRMAVRLYDEQDLGKLQL